MIRVRGARTHNLKNISLDIPRNRLVVLTGLSGSGKSSLAFDTLYAEGQRRYVESLSAYARQFLQLMDKPDVDMIEGLSPAIAIEQKSTSHNPRSTVGTVTEINDYLRLLFARTGTPYCPDHPDQRLESQSVSQMVDAILAQPEGTRLMILAPVVQNRKGEHLELFEQLQAQGFVRVRIRSEALHRGTDAGATGDDPPQPQVYDLAEVPDLDRSHRHSIDVVVDRVKVSANIRQRLAESLETALNLANGRVIVQPMDEGPDSALLFSSRYGCPVCNWSLPELEPRLFSFNNPMGACPECDGLGHTLFFDPDRIVQFPDLSLGAGAIRGWDRRNQFYYQQLQGLASHYQFNLDLPFNQLPENIRNILLYGSGTEAITFTQFSATGKPTTKTEPFEGIVHNFERRFQETDSNHVREELAKFQHTRVCPACHGTRLRIDARNVRVGPPGADRAIWEVSAWTLGETADWFEHLKLDGARAAVGERIIREIASRLRFLNNVGLNYLSLERSADTLSGGEAQRIRLASQIGSGLTGVMYVLDEPSIGLHQRDNDRLLETLTHLRDLGNSVLVVEHDEDAIRAADHIIDMGLGAGEHGGEVIAQGSVQDIIDTPESVTGQYLGGVRKIAVPAQRKAPGSQKISIINATGNNLKEPRIDIPVGLMVCVTGVSGSGKSTFARLITGLVQPSSGSIRINGIDVADMSPEARARHIGFAPQENYLVSGTIRDNIAFGRDISDKEIWAALKITQMDSVVRELPLKLSTPVGDMGSAFSGGQRQRFALSRAIAGKPSLLVLDEATSAVDVPTERAITAALRDLNMTLISIAHRPTAAGPDDTVLRFTEDGTIVTESPDYLKNLMESRG